MNKSLLLTAILAGFSAISLAEDEETLGRFQKVRYYYNDPRDCWTMEFGGGVQTVVTRKVKDFFSLGPQLELAFRKELHPYWALKGAFQVSTYRHDIKTADESTFISNWGDRPMVEPSETVGAWKQHISYISMTWSVNAMMNVLNVLQRQERVNPQYDFYAYLGAGGAYSAHNFGDRNGACFIPFWITGAQGFYNISERISAFANVQGSWLADDYQGYMTLNSSFKFAVMAGFAYRFSRNIHFQKIGEEVEEYKKRLSDAQNESDRIALFVEQAKKSRSLEIPSEFIEAAIFQIDRVELAKTYVKNLAYYADLIKSNPGTKFFVKGYSEMETGSARRNLWLSKKREEVVISILVENYGVDESQLIFGEMAETEPQIIRKYKKQYSRCVVICPVR